MNLYSSQHLITERYISSDFFTDSTWRTQALIKLLFYQENCFCQACSEVVLIT